MTTKARTRKPWSPFETDLLKRKFARRPNREIAAFTGHPVASVAAKARRLGLRKGPGRSVWKPWMLDILRDNYADTPNARLKDWLGVSVITLQLKAAELGLQKAGKLRRPGRARPDGRRRDVTPEEGDFIREHVGTHTKAAIARELGYAKCTISAYCRRHGIGA